ncbi:unnamed protein product [Dicrocoelium dendriticum]|nr:unnamed protein product [Dicrocoelium dendriticum]
MLGLPNLCPTLEARIRAKHLEYRSRQPALVEYQFLHLIKHCYSYGQVKYAVKEAVTDKHCLLGVGPIGLTIEEAQRCTIRFSWSQIAGFSQKNKRLLLHVSDQGEKFTYSYGLETRRKCRHLLKECKWCFSFYKTELFNSSNFPPHQGLTENGPSNFGAIRANTLDTYKAPTSPFNYMSQTMERPHVPAYDCTQSVDAHHFDHSDDGVNPVGVQLAHSQRILNDLPPNPYHVPSAAVVCNPTAGIAPRELCDGQSTAYYSVRTDPVVYRRRLKQRTSRGEQPHHQHLFHRRSTSDNRLYSRGRLSRRNFPTAKHYLIEQPISVAPEVKTLTLSTAMPHTPDAYTHRKHYILHHLTNCQHNECSLVAHRENPHKWFEAGNTSHPQRLQMSIKRNESISGSMKQPANLVEVGQPVGRANPRWHALQLNLHSEKYSIHEPQMQYIQYGHIPNKVTHPRTTKQSQWDPLQSVSITSTKSTAPNESQILQPRQFLFPLDGTASGVATPVGVTVKKHMTDFHHRILRCTPSNACALDAFDESQPPSLLRNSTQNSEELKADPMNLCVTAGSSVVRKVTSPSNSIWEPQQNSHLLKTPPCLVYQDCHMEKALFRTPKRISETTYASILACDNTCTSYEQTKNCSLTKHGYSQRSRFQDLSLASANKMWPQTAANMNPSSLNPGQSGRSNCPGFYDTLSVTSPSQVNFSLPQPQEQLASVALSVASLDSGQFDEVFDTTDEENVNGI